MRYDAPELQDALAAEYVLGTLRGPARRRFERLLIKRPALRGRVHGWEQRLNGMTARVVPQSPPPRVWRHIRKRLNPARNRRAGWRGWPTAALLASAACVALAVYIAVLPAGRNPEYLALIENNAGDPVWSITGDLDAGRLQARVLGRPEVGADQSLELWLLPPAAGEQPRSLGLLPVEGTGGHSVPAALLARAGEQASIAVTAEPRGGSPTGNPTGPIVYQGRLLRL